MYKCDCCGSVFAEERAATRPSRIYIHGDAEDEGEDVCPYCLSEDIYDYEPETADDE